MSIVVGHVHVGQMLEPLRLVEHVLVCGDNSTSADDLSGLLGALKRDRTLRRLNLCNRTLNNEQATLLADAPKAQLTPTPLD